MQAMQDVLEWGLGHRLSELTAGRLGFTAPVDSSVIIAGVALLSSVVWLLYWRTRAAPTGRLKILLVSLKTAALALLFLCLLMPTLTTSRQVAQERYLGIIVDNSSSMTIKDSDNGRSRGEVATALLMGRNGLLARLQAHFQTRLFRFDTGTLPISGMSDLTFTGSRTHLAQGLQQVAETLRGLPLSALLLLTDGADNSSADPVREARLLKSLGIPVYALGIGRQVLENDRAITQVSAARTVMQDAIFDVDITVQDRGRRERDFELRIEQEGNLVASKVVKVEERGASERYTLQLTPDRDGVLVYTAYIAETGDDLIPENNRHTFVVDTQKRRADVLYIEGHPRNEYKFIRRAVAGDQSLRLATYLQTGPHKFLRQGIDAPQELANGYPREKADLYRYEAIIFGDIPSQFFTAEQLAVTRDFVSERGGGFLMIGGATAFDEGFIASPIAEMLPVGLLRQDQLPLTLRNAPGKDDQPGRATFALRLTPAGERMAMLRMAREDEVNRQWWGKMPTLQGINATARAKPGATVLAIHPTLRYAGHPLPLIAQQRFGRGRTMVITTASTWRWQMLLPHDDLSHERFWRQILRHLTAAAPPPITLTLEHSAYSRGDEARLRVSVADATYSPLNDATVWLKITDPSGSVRDIQLEWSITEAGIYNGAFEVQREGVYSLQVASTSSTGAWTEVSTHFWTGPPHFEYLDAAMDADLLQRVADASGGAFYTPATASQLLNDLQRLRQTVSLEHAQPIWDMPLVLALLIGCFAVEWTLRRRKGLS